MAAMIVLVKLDEDVGPEDYERWVREDYLPAVKALPSVGEWRGYRVSGLLGSAAEPPFRYVVAVEIEDPEQLGRDMADVADAEALVRTARACGRHPDHDRAFRLSVVCWGGKSDAGSLGMSSLHPRKYTSI